MTDNVAIVDSGGANIASLRFAFDRLGATSVLTTDPDRLAGADRVVLPGVGAAEAAMDRLHQLELVSCLQSLSQPTLGICLGMQLLAAQSDEDQARCLSIIDGDVARFPESRDAPVPHMGWNQIRDLSEDPLLDGISENAYFYFVHSYALPVGADTIASCDYIMPFSAIVRRDNYYGTQFHPERSAENGAQLLRNFLTL
ncbi:MAG: imidazole glycerol phosphate synthase subunit HisH [Pseudomonadota bacterium]